MSDSSSEEETKDCPACTGTGRIHYYNPGWTETQICGSCSGTGKYSEGAKILEENFNKFSKWVKKKISDCIIS